MTQSVLSGKSMPFCPGCGHGISVKNISKALVELGYSPLDIVLVSDIGCCGLVDPLFDTHSVHGLHGRAPALGMGVSLGLDNPAKKVVVIQGDGGATIGLQHIMEAARRNVDMTLVVFNNLLYGMTGGQMSGLSSREFKENKQFDDGTPPFDVVKLAHFAGAAFSKRVLQPADFKESLKAAFSTKGFSLLEISSLCPSYGLKKLKDLGGMTAMPETFTNDRPPLKAKAIETASLFHEKDVLEQMFESKIEDRIGILIAGSAGGGIQLAAKLLAHAGILSGLHATMKGEYPITVGTGFSAAEVILSRHKINFSGLETPQVAIVLSKDGLNKARPRITSDTQLVLDESLRGKVPDAAHYGPFQKLAGKKSAAIFALAHWMEVEQLLKKDAFIEAARRHKYGKALMDAILLSEAVGF